MVLQSLVHPLPSVDIVERITGYTWALRGLCQQSGVKEIENKWSAYFQVTRFSYKNNTYKQLQRPLTNKMIPFKTSFESTPTLRSSRHNLSNFSGVSLLSMLKKTRRDICLKILHWRATIPYDMCNLNKDLKTYPLTLRKIASFCPLSLVELASRLVLREGTHLWTPEPGVFPRNSLKLTQNTTNITIQKYFNWKTTDRHWHLTLLHGD